MAEYGWVFFFFFSSRRRHTRLQGDWSSDVCSSDIGDGVVLTRSTLATAARVREWLAGGAERAGRDPSRIVVASLLPTAVGETREEALSALRPGLAFYAGFFPRYNRMMAEHGFVDE